MLFLHFSVFALISRRRGCGGCGETCCQVFRSSPPVSGVCRNIVVEVSTCAFLCRFRELTTRGAAMLVAAKPEQRNPRDCWNSVVLIFILSVLVLLHTHTQTHTHTHAHKYTSKCDHGEKVFTLCSECAGVNK